MKHPFKNPEVAALFESYSPQVRSKLLALRDLIFEIAAQTKSVGELEETLKWGQPSYLTSGTKSGSIIRIDRIKAQPEQYAIYFHCQTNLISTFREIYPRGFKYQGNRAIIFNVNEDVPAKPLRHCILLALTYFLQK